MSVFVVYTLLVLLVFVMDYKVLGLILTVIP